MRKGKLKVLFVIDTLYNAGAEKSLFEITSNFTEVTPIFVHIYKENTLKQAFQEKDIKVHSLNVPGSWNLKIALKRLKKVYEMEKPDIVHATLYRSEMLTRKLKKSFPDTPLINSLVNDSYNSLKLKNETLFRKLKGKVIQFLDAYTARRVDFFISNSKAIKESKSRHLNLPKNKIKVIYRGRDSLKFGNNTNKDVLNGLREEYNLYGKRILLNVGRLIESKGQQDIISVMPDIIETYPDSVLLIAGEGVKRLFLEDQIRDLNLEKNVFLLGNRNDIPELLELADIFVFPTYMEGLPGALIEAMFSKTLICCSDIPVNLECVNEKTAVIFKVGDKKDIQSKLNYIISNFENLTDKPTQAYKEACEKFSIGTVADQYQKFYFSLVRGDSLPKLN